MATGATIAGVSTATILAGAAGITGILFLGVILGLIPVYMLKCNVLYFYLFIKCIL